MQIFIIVGLFTGISGFPIFVSLALAALGIVLTAVLFRIIDWPPV